MPWYCLIVALKKGALKVVEWIEHDLLTLYSQNRVISHRYKVRRYDGTRWILGWKISRPLANPFTVRISGYWETVRWSRTIGSLGKVAERLTTRFSDIVRTFAAKFVWFFMFYANFSVVSVENVTVIFKKRGNTHECVMDGRRPMLDGHWHDGCRGNNNITR